MKFIAICESDFSITEEVEEELKNTIFVGNEDCPYCFEITKIINDEVISELKENNTQKSEPDDFHEYWDEMAISELKGEDLKKQNTGCWIFDETDNSITCNKCGCLIWANDISNGEAHYCPNCGAKMKGENNA